LRGPANNPCAGHTWGSICLLYKNQALLPETVSLLQLVISFSGNSELNPPVKMYSRVKQAIKSLSMLLQYDFTAILPSHGTSIGERGKEKLQTMLQEFGLYSCVCVFYPLGEIMSSILMSLWKI